MIAAVIALLAVSFNAYSAESYIGYRWVVSPIPKHEAIQFQRNVLAFFDASLTDAFFAIDKIDPLFAMAKKISALMLRVGETKYPMYTKPAALDYAQKLDQLDLYLYPWVSTVKEAIGPEITHLEFMLSLNDPQAFAEAKIQLKAIKNLLLPLLQKTRQFEVSIEHPIRYFEDAQRLLNIIQDYVEDLYFYLNSAIQRIADYPEVLSVSYGSDAFLAMVAKRPAMPLSLLEKLLRYVNPFTYFPEAFKPKRQTLLALGGLSLVLGQCLADAIRPTQSQCSLSAIKKINKEVAVIGTVLTDKYAALAQPHFLQKLSKHYPFVALTLQAKFIEHSNVPFSRNEIQMTMDNHRAQRLADLCKHSI